MAFLFCESFDWSPTLADYYNKWPSPGSINGTIQASSGRRSGGRIALGTFHNVIKYLTPGSATCILGFAVQADAATAHPYVQIGDNTVTHVRINFASDGTINAYRGDNTTLLGTSSAGAWHYTWGWMYVEVKVKVDDSVGTVEVKVNGVTKLTLSSQDTRNGGTAGWTFFGVRWSSTGTSYLDDLYCCDSSGSAHNDFLGDVRVECHYPNANGTSSMSTPSTGSDRYATVDEAADPNDDTDYNTVAAVSDKDTLGLQNLINAGGVLYGVQVQLWAKKANDGVGALAPVLRESGTDYDGTGVYLATTYGHQAQAYDLSPAGNAWTEAIFNALEVGYKRTI